MKHAWPIAAATAAVLLIAVFLVMGTPVRQEVVWIDSVSGSEKRQTVRRLGASPPPVVADSPLALRYRRLGLRWEPDWRSVQGTYRDLFGRDVGRAHDWPAPEIYFLAQSPDLQRSYLAAATDGDVREFFHVMSTGSEAQKKAAVEAACDKALATEAAPRPGG